LEYFSSAQGSHILQALVQTIRDNTALLSELDGAIGDGDHGVNMNKGFSLAAGRMGDSTDLATGLEIVGETLLTEIGGAMGPLYGTFFTEMAVAAAGVREIDATIFGAMLDAGLAGVADLGGAHVGDKTLIDTLVPARDAFIASMAAGADFRVALQRLVEAAERGKESTRDLVAQVGRASRLGERSRGAVDAGAASCCLILASLATSIEACLETAPIERGPDPPDHR
jgi:dihydroxyacetone kinase-like protein